MWRAKCERNLLIQVHPAAYALRVRKEPRTRLCDAQGKVGYNRSTFVDDLREDFRHVVQEHVDGLRVFTSAEDGGCTEALSSVVQTQQGDGHVVGAAKVIIR